MWIQVIWIQVLPRSDPVTDAHVLHSVSGQSCIQLIEVKRYYLVEGRLGIGIPSSIAITTYINGKEIVVQGPTCSGITAKWHNANIPVIDVLDSLSLTLRRLHVPVVMMHLVFLWSKRPHS